MDEFRKVLTKARKGSPYPNLKDFALSVQISRRNYYKYEVGEGIPTEEYLERIILRGSIPDELANHLRQLRKVALMERVGIKVENSLLEVEIDVEKLTQQIQKEVEYELKRAGVRLMPSTKRVCARRIYMLLDAALRKP